MGRGWSVLVLLVIAVALGGYAYYDSKQPPPTEKKLEKVFTGVEADKIDQVTIKPESGERTTAQKQSGDWHLTSPEAAKADAGELSGITSSLSSLEVQRVVDDKPSDLKPYGLATPRIVVDFSAGGKKHELQIGQKTPTGSDLYAKVPDNPRVFLVSSYLEGTFNRKPFDLRDKSILNVDRDKVDTLDIQTSNRHLTFAKSGSDWKITSPVSAPADFNAVDGLVGRLNTTQMKAITAADPKDLKPYGLDEPDVTVKLAAGSSQAALAIGKTAGDALVYAKDLSRPMVFTIDASLVSDLKKGADDFRLKDLFNARAFNTTRVQIVRNGQTTVFEKSGEKWKETAPAKKDADTAKVDALVTALTGTHATSFVAATKDTGLDEPELTATLQTDDGKHEEVAFGKHGSDVFARRDGEAGAAKIDAATLDGIVKAIEALK
ncbi:MAG TPA: DUF4340 domain-containing protein [Vicinamibacterales bacterium]|nr:DUF4340 domain-containing protein [Vicinamibacterales bacterium]